jgi:hypothetical protein
VFSRPLSFRTVALAGVAAAALAASTAVASAPATASAASLGVSCPTPNSQVFLPWQDAAFYALAPNGGFENAATGWTIAGGAKVVTGNESFAVSGPGSHSLALPAGSSVTSPRMCVGLLSSKMRFFAANAGAAGSHLKVQVLYGGGTGGLLGGVGSLLGVSDVGSMTAGKAWQPSSEVPMLGGTLPLLTQWVQFRFTPADASGSWRIDDIYLDPLMHR